MTDNTWPRNGFPYALIHDNNAYVGQAGARDAWSPDYRMDQHMEGGSTSWKRFMQTFGYDTARVIRVHLDAGVFESRDDLDALELWWWLFLRDDCGYNMLNLKPGRSPISGTGRHHGVHHGGWKLRPETAARGHRNAGIAQKGVPQSDAHVRAMCLGRWPDKAATALAESRARHPSLV